MALPRLTTSDYDEPARNDLGLAITRAREAAGWLKRADFASHAKVSLRSLVKLENGEPGVGRKVLEAVGRALPGWTEDSPYEVLGGGAAPAGGQQEEPEPVLSPEAERLFQTIKNMFELADIPMTPRMLEVFHDEVGVQLAKRRLEQAPDTQGERSS